MKKLLALALLLVSISANAQLKWGVEAGLNMNKLTTHRMSDHNLGFFIGPKAQVSLLGMIVDASLQYSQTKIDIDNAKSKTLPNIVVPVNFKYCIGLGSAAAVYVSTGPQWNWYVGSAGKGYDFKASSFNWNVGAGVHCLKHIQFGVTYSIALQDNATFFDKLSTPFVGKNNIWQVRLAYMF